MVDEHSGEETGSEQQGPKARASDAVREPAAPYAGIARRRGPTTGSVRRRLDTTSPTVRAAFLRRVRSWARDVAATAPEEALADVLASPTMRGGLVRLLSRGGLDLEASPEVRLREEALARGLVARERLRELAGGFRATTWVAAHLGITRQAVDKRRRAGKLLAFEAADGSFEYPFCQFADEGVVPGLEGALAAFAVENPWERLSALVNPSPALSGRSVVEVLRDARSAEERTRAFAVVRDFLR